MSFYKANNSYNASLTADYTAGDATLSVNTVPSNFPTIVTVARGTTKETRFYVTAGGAGLLTGVSRLDGANENISSGVSVEVMNDAEYINQLSSAVFDQAALKGLVYAADGGASDTYAITLAVAPSAYTDILGLPISFKANTVNTGAATLNVNTLGAKTIKKNYDQTLSDGDIKSGQIVTVAYDGTNFQLQSVSGLEATSLKSATTSVDVASATAPTTGQVLTSTDSTHATWQTPSVGVSTSTAKFRAHANATQAILNTTSTKVSFQVEDYDPGNNFDNATNFRFTAPTTGYYQVSANIQFDGVYSDAQLIFYVNGSPYVLGQRGSSIRYCVYSDIIKLTAADYIEVYAYQASGITHNLENVYNGSYFAAHLLST